MELGPVDPPKSRPKAGTDLWSRPLYAYKPRQRRVGQPGAGARRRGAKTRHKGGPPRAHTTEAYLKTPLPAYRAWSSQGGGPTGGRGGPGAAKLRRRGGGGTPPRFGSSCW